MMMLNDNGGSGREWGYEFLKYPKIEIQILNSLNPKKSFIHDENIAYLCPPSPSDRGIMPTYGVGRKHAEE